VNNRAQSVISAVRDEEIKDTTTVVVREAHAFALHKLIHSLRASYLQLCICKRSVNKSYGQRA
jgi:hypothetical protein